MATHCIHPLSGTQQARRGRGFTLLEILMALTVVGLLSAVALPSYARIMQRQKVEQCARDLRTLATYIERYRLQHVDAPMSLGALGITLPKDPWGRDYQFLNFNSPAPGVAGLIRKDHNLHPLNSEFDLYSLGKDGRSFPALTAGASKDDVIWARDGDFVGLASDY
jgi:general secretion pathway protein G